MTESGAAGAVTPVPSEPDGRVFGAPTTLRFALLALLFVAAGAGLSVQIIGAVPGLVENGWGCLLADGHNPESGTVLGTPEASVEGSSLAALRACEERYVTHTEWVPFAVVSVLVLAAAVLYRALSWWMGRRLLEVEQVDPDGRLRRDLDDLVAVAGLGVPVRFAIVPGMLRSGAAVFGTRRRPVVRVTSGLTVVHRADPDRFRAIVLHELAHIRNGDIPVFYATLALWRVFLVAVLLPAAGMAAYQLTTDQYPAAWHIASLRVFLLIEEALIVVMVYLARADVLRTREMHADLTAVRLWRMSPDELHGGRPADAGEPTGLRRAVAAAGEPWRRHPSWPQRRRVLVAPDALFGTGVLPMFTTGLIADIFANQLGTLLPSSVSALGTIRILLAAGLVTAIGGAAVRRAVRYAGVRNRAAPSGWAAGFWLGTGLAVGELAAESASAGRWLLPHPEAVALLIAVVMLLMAWIAEYTGLRAGARRGRTSFAGTLIGIAPAWLALAYALSWWGGNLLVYGWRYNVETALRVLEVPVDHPPLFARITAILPEVLPNTGVLSLWWSPALLWLLPLVWARPPGLARIVLAGLRGGAAACAGLLAGRLAVDTVRTLHGSIFVGAELSWILIVLTGAMVVTAVVVAASTPSCPLISALIAAGVVALTGTLGAVLQLVFSGCLGPADVLMAGHCSILPAPLSLLTLWTSFVLGPAVVLCLGAAAIAQAARRLSRRPTRTVTRADAPAGTRRRFVVAIVVTATVAVVTLDTATTAEPRSTSASAGPLLHSGPPPSPRTEKLQVNAWASYGGVDLINRIHTMDHTTLIDVLTKIGRAGGDIRSVENRLVPPACTAVIKLARDADRYFLIPVAAGRRYWADAVAALDDAARACHRPARQPYAALLAAFWDVVNAQEAVDHLSVWMGRGETPLGAQRFVAASGEYQPLTYHGATFRFAAANLAVRHTGTGAGRVATLDAAACLTAAPGHTTTSGDLPSLGDWRLVFPDGRRVAPVRTHPGDVDAPPYPAAPTDALDATGDCVAGRVTFGIPAAEHGDPRTVAFASPQVPTVLTWRPPDPRSNQIDLLGATRPITAGDPQGWTAVTGYAVHTAGPNHDHIPPADRLATITVVTCASGVPAATATARRPWKLLLADGVVAFPVRSRPGDRSPDPALYPNGRERVGPRAGCRSGSIPFDIPAADTSDTVAIYYEAPHVRHPWRLTPMVP